VVISGANFRPTSKPVHERNAARAAGLLIFLLVLIWVVPVMGYNSQERFVPRQPVPFSHQHHVSGLGIDGRYCHATVEVSQNAGMPPTHTCMTPPLADLG
jgi:hypothetical protein